MKLCARAELSTLELGKTGQVYWCRLRPYIGGVNSPRKIRAILFQEVVLLLRKALYRFYTLECAPGGIKTFPALRRAATNGIAESMDCCQGREELEFETVPMEEIIWTICNISFCAGLDLGQQLIKKRHREAHLLDGLIHIVHPLTQLVNLGFNFSLRHSSLLADQCQFQNLVMNWFEF